VPVRKQDPEKALEGKYVIQSEEPDLGPVQAVEAYKELSEVERSFGQLKDLVEMRPIYHHRPKRVRAHICVAALAFQLSRALEKKLKAAGVPISSAQALEALRTMHVVDIRIGEQTRRGVTAGNHSTEEDSATIRERVTRARFFQLKRFSGQSKVTCNARMTSRQLRKHCVLDQQSIELLRPPRSYASP
jgi:Magnesium chelatase, subunit ChlI C-terminal